MTKTKKTIKAWAVFYPGPYGATICQHRTMRRGMDAYLTEDAARENLGMCTGDIVIPITITYEVPKKTKKK